MRKILVHADGLPASATRLHTAAALAREHGAALCAVVAESPEAVDMAYGYAAAGAGALAVQQQALERRARARATFDRVMGPAADDTAGWLELNGDQPARTLARHACCADLVVLGQPDPQGNGASQGFVETVLLECGRPVLLLPASHRGPLLLDTAVVAWKPSAECARALAGALPLLQRARQVLLVSWAEEPLPQGGHVDVEGYLAAHQLAARVHREARSPRDVGAALAQLCDEVGAGLLVMGCYSRPRLRERVLGGATRSLLRALPLPVLMAH
jgi:nucleotide-binding universal stress UspA family protein